jgi:hypothetical protein
MMTILVLLVAGVIPGYLISKALGHARRPDYSFFGVKELPGPKPLACQYCGKRVKRDPNRNLCPYCKKMLE